MRSQPVGIAADQIQPILDLVVNKSSTYEGMGSLGPIVEFDVCSVVDDSMLMLDVVRVVLVVGSTELDVERFCFTLETSLLSIPDDTELVFGLVRCLYSALSQSL